MSLTAEKAEILGALFGDKSLFGIYPRYRHYKGYDYSRYKQGIVRICLGKDKEWGTHLSDLTFETYSCAVIATRTVRQFLIKAGSNPL